MGTLIDKDQTEDAEEMFLNKFGVRVHYLGTICTLPLDGEGGRHDAVFSLHLQDMGKFASARFQMGNDIPRWWEDYVANNREIIPKEDLNRF